MQFDHCASVKEEVGLAMSAPHEGFEGVSRQTTNSTVLGPRTSEAIHHSGASSHSGCGLRGSCACSPNNRPVQDDNGSAMSTILFERVRQDSVVSCGTAVAFNTERVPDGSAASLRGSRRGDPTAQDGLGREPLHDTSATVLANDDDSRSTTYVLQLNSPSSGQHSHAEAQTEARQLVFDDGDDVVPTVSPPPASLRNLDESHMAFATSSPHPAMRRALPTADPLDTSTHGGTDDGAAHIVGSPEPRLVAHSSDGTTSCRESGHRSDEGLVPSIARDETESVEGHLHDDRQHSHRNPHGAHERGVLSDDEGAAEWVLTLHGDEDQFRALAAKVGTGQSALSLCPPRNGRGADEEALVSSRSRTRGSSGSLALPPPPPPMRRTDQRARLSPAAHVAHTDDMSIKPDGAGDDVEPTVEEAGVRTPSVAREVSRPRRLLPPPPPPPPPLEGEEASAHTTPVQPVRRVRVLCAPSPSPPRSSPITAVTSTRRSGSTTVSVLGDVTPHEAAVDNAPMVPVVVVAREANMVATLHVTEKTSTTLSAAAVLTPSGSSSFTEANVRCVSTHPTSQSMHNEVDPASFTQESPTACGEERDSGSRSQLADHMRPVEAPTPALPSDSLICADTNFSRAPPQATDLCDPATQLRRLSSSSSSSATASPERPLAAGDASPSPIRPTGGGGSHSVDSTFDDGENETGSSDSGEEPCLQHAALQPPVAGEAGSTPLHVFECGVDGEGHVSCTDTTIASSSSSVEMKAEATASHALRSQLAVEVEKRLEREEECASLHQLVDVLREKLNTATVAALVHHGGGERKALNGIDHSGDGGVTPCAAADSSAHPPTSPVAAGAGEDTREGTDDARSYKAEAHLWQARHDQLAAELAHVKQQLAEQKAVLDVLGLVPPYPDELLGAARRVVRRLHHPNAGGADRTPQNTTDVTDVDASVADVSALGTPVPIIATLYRRSEECGKDAEKKIAPDETVPWSERQQRAASTAQRALSELSANRVRLGSVGRLLAKSRERIEEEVNTPVASVHAPTTAVEATTTSADEQHALTLSEVCGGRSVAEVLRLKRVWQQPPDTLTDSC